MEFVIVVLAVWLVASLAVALVVGRSLRAADIRDRRTTVTAAGAPALRDTRRTDAGVHETA